MLPVLRLGPLALHTPGLVILAGIWLGMNIVERSARRRGLPADVVLTAITFGLFSGVVGARLTYVLGFLPVYLDSPLDSLSLSPTALDPVGGAVAGGVVAAAIIQSRRLPWLGVLDTLAAGLAVLGVAFGLSHVASGAAYGAPTDLPWAIALWGTDRHPTQFVETLVALAVMALIVRRSETQPGLVFALWVALAGGSRLILEGLRGDSALGPGGMRTVQVAALAVTLFGLWLYGWLVRRTVASPVK